MLIAQVATDYRGSLGGRLERIPDREQILLAQMTKPCSRNSLLRNWTSIRGQSLIWRCADFGARNANYDWVAVRLLFRMQFAFGNLWCMTSMRTPRAYDDK
jgi:hypothetical protein